MKFVAAPRSAIRPTKVRSASPMRLFGASAEYESDATGDSQCRQRFFLDVFDDVPLLPMRSLQSYSPSNRIPRGGLC
jgi:hypothetical protein